MKILFPVFILLVFVPKLGLTQYSNLPISLSLPFDKDTIEEHEPTFVWQTNLAVVQNDPRISQQIVVVKLEPHQTSTEAIIENQPVFVRADVVSNTLTYSSTDQALEEGNIYAWQITYFYNGMQVQQSEVSTFVLTKPIMATRNFVRLKKQNDGSYFPISETELNFSTSEKGSPNLTGIVRTPNGKNLKVNLVELVDGKPITTVNLNPQYTRYFTIDLSSFNLENGFYNFEWKYSSNQSYTLNFELKK